MSEHETMAKDEAQEDRDVPAELDDLEVRNEEGEDVKAGWGRNGGRAE